MAPAAYPACTSTTSRCRSASKGYNKGEAKISTTWIEYLPWATHPALGMALRSSPSQGFLLEGRIEGKKVAKDAKDAKGSKGV
jgi:hypothetical protein